MNKRIALSMTTLLLALGLSAGAVLAAEDGSVTITSPEDGATIDAMAQNEVVYEVVPGPRGDHVHVFVDDVEVDILRQLSGSYTLPADLEAGEREVCIRVVNRAHVPTGTEECITLNVE
jgi:hypothetical protein